MSFLKTDFSLSEIPQYHPSSEKYLRFWKEQKRRCIEGYWVDGRWMPGKLYFYINFGTIKLNKEGSKVKSYGRPWLRDLEWDFFYNWAEARGFAGFELDEKYTCLREVKVLRDTGATPSKAFKRLHPNAFTPEGKLKRYVPAREYLRKKHAENLGRPIFGEGGNPSLNLFMMGSRGYGKSYSVGVGIVAHEWLFDGKTIYDPGAPVTAAEVVMGAGDAKFSSETLDKTKEAIERLPGSIEINGVFYPCPFYKQYSGSWQPAKQVTASYKKKIGGNWVMRGSKSNIKHRTFKDNPHAANGTRPGVLIFEEVGMFDNLKESYGSTVECQRNGSYKFGSMMFLGTGGDMNGGGTLDAMDIFYNPHDYECVEFNDEWEMRGKVGYFVPAYIGLNQFKDEYGNTDIESAKKYLQNQRNKYRKTGGSMAALEAEIVNRPITPSEMFLQRSGNIFPIADLRRRLDLIEDSWQSLEKKVELIFDPNAKATNGVDYKIDTRNRLNPINKFPWKEVDREGCVVIYELPRVTKTEGVPEGAYIIGHDPYASDDPYAESCAVTIVMKSKKYFTELGHDEIVAIHVSRPFAGRHEVNENLHKLSLFYGNAKIYFENVRGNVKEYFEKIKRLDLLARQPTTVLTKKASYENRGASQPYGYPMSSKQMKIEGIQYVRDWLMEERGQDNQGRVLRNLDRIWDRALLRELIAFNMDGNFDRVMALIGCVIGMAETYNKFENALEQTTEKDEIVTFLRENKYVFTR